MGLKDLLLDDDDKAMLEKLKKGAKHIDTLETDLPKLLQRVERIEILIYAMSYKNKEEDPKWQEHLDRAREFVERENQRIKTTIR